MAQRILGLGAGGGLGPRSPIGVAFERDVARQDEDALGDEMDVILEPALDGDVEAIAADGASGGDGVTQLPRVGFVAGVREQRLEGAAEHGLRRAAHRPRRRPVHVGAAPVAIVERDVIAERVEDVEKTLGR